MYFKIEAIKIKIPLERIYERLQSGENLTDIYKSLSFNMSQVDETQTQMYIPEEIVQGRNEFVFDLK
jgi:hypothetical protein